MLMDLKSGAGPGKGGRYLGVYRCAHWEVGVRWSRGSELGIVA